MVFVFCFFSSEGSEKEQRNAPNKTSCMLSERRAVPAAPCPSCQACCSWEQGTFSRNQPLQHGQKALTGHTANQGPTRRPFSGARRLCRAALRSQHKLSSSQAVTYSRLSCAVLFRDPALCSPSTFHVTTRSRSSGHVQPQGNPKLNHNTSSSLPSL